MRSDLPLERYVLSDAAQDPPADAAAFLRRLRGREARALTAQVRQAGASIDLLRLRIFLGVAGAAALAILAGVLWSLRGDKELLLDPEAVLIVAGVAFLIASPLVIAGGVALAFPLAAAYRRLQRERLRRRLTDLPRQRVASILASLKEEHMPDTRALRDALAAQLLPSPREVTPARPPADNGREPLPRPDPRRRVP